MPTPEVPARRREDAWLRPVLVVGTVGALVLVFVCLVLGLLTRIREESARAQSMENLRLIGQATHECHDTFDVLPLVSGHWKGFQFAYPGDAVEVSIFTCLLPYLDAP